MVIAVSIFELHISQARSLKQKRKVVKGLIERIHQRFRVSIAETDHHDLHQRAQITFALVAQSDGDAEHKLDKIRDLIDIEPESSLLDWNPQFLDLLS